MSKSDAILTNELFYCEHLVLNRDTMNDIDDFRVTIEGGEGLMEYLQNYAFHDEAHNAQKIYLIRDIFTEKLVGYFGLRAGLISANEHKVKVGNEEITVFNTVSGIELAEIALDDDFRNKGYGLIIFHDFIIPIVKMASEYIGCEILYAFSVDTDGALLRKYINDYNFMRLDPESETKLHERLRSQFDKGCVFIYQSI